MMPSQAAPDPRPPLFTPGFVAVLTMLVAFGMSLSTFLLLPKFLKVELGADALQIGLVGSMFGLASVVAIPFAGSWIDRYGCRASIVVGNLILAASALGYLLVRSTGPLALILRGLQGLAWNMVFNAGMAMATLLAPANRIAEAIAVYGSANLATNALAPAIAESLIDVIGYRPVFAAAAVVGVVAAWMGRRLVQPPSAPVGAGGVAARTTLRALFRQTHNRRLMAVCGLSGLAFTVMFYFHQPFALKLGIRNVRGFFIGYTVGALVVRLAAGSLIDRVGHGRVARISLVFYGAVTAATAALAPGWLGVYGTLFGMAQGIFYPALMAMAADPRVPGQRAQILMLMSGSFAAGSIFGPLLGALADAVGFPIVFITSGVVAAVSAVLIPEAAPPAA